MLRPPSVVIGMIEPQSSGSRAWVEPWRRDCIDAIRNKEKEGEEGRHERRSQWQGTSVIEGLRG